MTHTRPQPGDALSLSPPQAPPRTAYLGIGYRMDTGERIRFAADSPEEIRRTAGAHPGPIFDLNIWHTRTGARP